MANPLRDRVAQDASDRLSDFANPIAGANLVALVFAVAAVLDHDQPGRMEWALLGVVAGSAVAVMLAYYSMHVLAWFSTGPLSLRMLLFSIGIVAAQGLMIFVVVRAADLDNKSDQLLMLRHWLAGAGLFAGTASLANLYDIRAGRVEQDPAWQQGASAAVLAGFRVRQRKDSDMAARVGLVLLGVWLVTIWMTHNEAVVLTGVACGAAGMLSAIWNNHQTSEKVWDQLRQDMEAELQSSQS